MHNGFKVGDFIEVTPQERDKGTDKDFGVIRGTALDERGLTGLASFRVVPNGMEGVLVFDLNHHDVKRLFRPGRERGRA